MMEENTVTKPDKKLYFVFLNIVFRRINGEYTYDIRKIIRSKERQSLIDSLEFDLKLKSVQLRIPNGRKINYFKVTEKPANNFHEFW
jgi:hypothetical protein